jgi:hypothetical protein
MLKKWSISGVRQEVKGREDKFDRWLSVQTQKLFVEKQMLESEDCEQRT